MKAVYEQSRVNQLADEPLLDLIGALYENLKTIDEAIVNDPHIIKVTEELAEYKEQHYLAQKKAYRSRLKAARLVAKSRGLKFEVPEIKE